MVQFVLEHGAVRDVLCHGPSTEVLTRHHTAPYDDVIATFQGLGDGDADEAAAANEREVRVRTH